MTLDDLLGGLMIAALLISPFVGYLLSTGG